MNDQNYNQPSDRINISSIKAAVLSRGRAVEESDISMAAMRHAMVTPRTPGTAAQQWGTLCHAYILQRDLIAPSTLATRREKGWKDYAADCTAQNLIPATAGELAKLGRVYDAVMDHPTARRIIDQATATEHILEWEHNGLELRGRADILGEQHVADLKMMRDIDKRRINAAIYGGMIDCQLGWYADGWASETGRQVVNHWVICVQSAPPHQVEVVNIPPQIVAAGLEYALQIARRYQVCRMVGSYPDAYGGGFEYEPPRWATFDSETDISTGTMEASEL